MFGHWHPTVLVAYLSISNDANMIIIWFDVSDLSCKKSIEFENRWLARVFTVTHWQKKTIKMGSDYLKLIGANDIEGGREREIWS